MRNEFLFKDVLNEIFEDLVREAIIDKIFVDFSERGI